MVHFVERGRMRASDKVFGNFAFQVARTISAMGVAHSYWFGEVVGAMGPFIYYVSTFSDISNPPPSDLSINKVQKVPKFLN